MEKNNLLDLVTQPFNILGQNCIAINTVGANASKHHLNNDDVIRAVGNYKYHSAHMWYQVLRNYWVLGEIKQKEGIVDICCGPAEIIRLLHRNMKSPEFYIGIDALHPIEKKFKVGNLDVLFIQHNVSKSIPLQDGSCSVCIFMESLEHFTKPVGMLLLEECVRILGTKGVMFFTTPLKGNAITSPERNPFHIYIWGKEELEEAFAAVGVEIVYKRVSAIPRLLELDKIFKGQQWYDSLRSSSRFNPISLRILLGEMYSKQTGIEHNYLAILRKK